MGCGLTIHLCVSDQPHLSPSDSPGGPIAAGWVAWRQRVQVLAADPLILCMLGIFVCVLSPVGSVWF